MEEALKKQIALLEQIIELQKQLLAVKGMSYPVYVPYTPYQPIDPWKWNPVWTGSGTISGDNITYTTADYICTDTVGGLQ